MTRRLQALVGACLVALMSTPAFATSAGKPADAARQNRNTLKPWFDHNGKYQPTHGVPGYQHSVGEAAYAPVSQQRQSGPRKYKAKAKKPRKAVNRPFTPRVIVRHARVSSAVYRGSAVILPHPPGCPSRAFCGCGAALEVFGKHVRSLWLARNWFQFPRTTPAPGMVAVRRHHVFVIREVRAPGLVLAYDANSGGRKTRLHLRPLRGYVVVNPRGSRYASAG